MHKRNYFISLFLLALMLLPSSSASAQDTPPTSPWDLISQTNVLRESYGYADLTVDGILMATAQSTAEIMASYQSCTHLASMGYPNASARAMSAGYGGGATAFVTENIACGVSAFPDLYSTYWADYEHLRPVNGPQAGLYIHAGAGAAQDSTGKWYYVLQVGYTSGSYNASTAVPTLPGGITATFGPTSDQRIFDIVTATANSDGSIIHVVQPGQTLWGIADTYKVDAAIIKALNGMTVDTIYPNQKLIIRTAFTPTISPTITETPKPATRTPRPTSTPLPPTQTLIPSVTPTPTRAPLFPEITFMQGNRRVLGFGIIIICAAGLVFLVLSGKRRR
jgi:LysM repeat protein